MAFIDQERNVDTALIGPIPKSIMKADLDVILTQTHNNDIPLSFVLHNNFSKST
jgi:hypothetical protein